MLPTNLKYGNRAQSSMARSYTSNIQPNGALSGYTKGSVTTIMIPTGFNLALVSPESILKFEAVLTGGAVTLDGRLDSCGAHGYIQKLRVFHGSNLIEETDNYALAVKQYMDLQVSTDATYGKYSILAGTRSDQYLGMADDENLLPLAIATDLGSTSALANQLRACVMTESAKCVNSGALVEHAVSNTYCITLLSLLGSLCSNNYFPLFACTSAPLRLEIQWANSLQSVGAFPDTTDTFTINSIEYIASYIALSSEARILINSQGALSFTIQGIRNYNTTSALANGGTTQINFNIPAKFTSVKSVIACVRDTARSVNTALYFPFSCDMYGLQNYYFKIGSHSSIPAIAPSCVPQFFSELLKAVDSISDLNHHPSIDIDSYQQPVGLPNTATSIAVGSVNSGSFYVGLDLENYANSDKSTIYTGYNTKLDDMFLTMNFSAPNAMNARFDAFVMFDQELVFMDNTCYVSF